MQSIEKELLERLEKGVYGDIYNYPVEKYNKLLDDMEVKDAISEDEEEVVFSFCSFLLYCFVVSVRPKTKCFLIALRYGWKLE